MNRTFDVFAACGTLRSLPRRGAWRLAPGPRPHGAARQLTCVPRPRTFAAALLLLLPALAGCETFGHQDPVWEIEEEEHLVIMPFKDPDFPDRWEGNPRGHDAALRTTQILQREAEFGVRPYEDVIGLFQAEDMSKLSPREVAALCKAEYVLVCDFEELELKDPKSIGLSQGSAQVRVRLFQVERKSEEDEERAARRAEDQRQARERAGMPTLDYDRGGRFIPDAERVISAKFPSDFMSPGGEPFLESPDIEQGLLATVAKKVAKLYYPHQAEKIDTD